MQTHQDIAVKEFQPHQAHDEQYQNDLSNAIQTAKNIVSMYEIVSADLFQKGKKESKKALKASKKSAEVKKVQAKYRDPITGKEWSGRGITPLWIRDQDKSQFLIQ
jgi:DNA-binding protein H-NS